MEPANSEAIRVVNETVRVLTESSKVLADTGNRLIATEWSKIQRR
jgi:hypothetical protein